MKDCEDEFYNIKVTQAFEIERVVKTEKSRYKNLKEAENLVAEALNNAGFGGLGELVGEHIRQEINGMFVDRDGEIYRN